MHMSRSISIYIHIRKQVYTHAYTKIYIYLYTHEITACIIESTFIPLTHKHDTHTHTHTS